VARVAGVSALPVRQPGIDYGEDIPLFWNASMPELSAAANSISMLMPYVEPLIARTARAAAPGLDEPLRSQTLAFARQELAHHGQHRRFNDGLVAQCPGLARAERWIERAYAWMDRRWSPSFKIASAAASETIAFAIARWVEAHMTTVFDGADPRAVRLFTWHLAEEVEHKTAAFDVFEATGGRRLRYTAAAAVSLAVLLWFTYTCSLTMLHHAHRLRLPVTWFRLARWSFSLAFTLLPLLGASCLPGHGPRVLSDPPYLTQWLRGLPPARREQHGADADDPVAADDAEHETVARVVDVPQPEAGAADGEGHRDGDEPARARP
jgi:predicted metal-dependent hydrolase